jgi:hypothetical protein
MSLDNFISELHSMGFSEEVITEVIQSLADLYIASKIPYAFVNKSSWPYTPENIKRTKYWTYSEITEKILKQHEFIDSSSAYTIYSKYTNWYFIALTEKGLPIAKEAYENRLQNNLSFINELIKKYKYLLPILYYGASYDNTLKRFYFFHNYKINIIDFYYKHIINAKIGWSPGPPIRRQGYHTTQELWDMLKEKYIHEKLNIVSMAFQSIASTKVMRDAINEFFTQLYEKRLVLLMPNFSSSRVYEEERWIVTDELLNIMKEKITEKQIEKLKGIIRDYVTMLLLYLGEEGYTKGQISSIIGMIVDENKDLNISHYELEDEFYKMVNKISSLTGSISKFNEAGGPESRPFLILNYNELDNTIKTFLEDLGSKTISSLMNHES